MNALVLVHGGMHGPWCWDQVVPLLRDAGHEVHPVALPGRDGTNVTGLSLDAYADVVADAVMADGPPAVLVAAGPESALLADRLLQEATL